VLLWINARAAALQRDATAEQPSCGQDARDWHAKQDSFEDMGGKPFTYQHQPNNIGAWRIGEACCAAKPGGDYIDHGLSLLQQLQMRGYGIVPVAAIAAQQRQDGAK
jgi:hypothetical protein